MESNQSSSSHKSKRSTRLNYSTSADINMGDGGDSSFSSHSSEKRMKKDDSGINVNKCESDSSDEEAPGLLAKRNKAPSVDSKKAGNISELNSPDSGNQESCSLNDFHDHPSSEADLPSSENVASSEKSEKSNENDSSDKIDYLVNSCSDDDGDCDDSEKKKKEDDKIKYDPTPLTPKPTHNWTASKAMLNRQYGSSVRYSPDIFRYNCYGSLHMVERLELMYKMRKHEGCVNALHFNSSGTRLVTGSDDMDIIIWDWTISEPVLLYTSGHRSNVFQAKFLPLSGDSQVASCARDGQVRVAELSATGVCKETRKVAQHKGAAHKLAVQMDSPHTFLSCGEDAAVFEIDLREGKPEKLLMCRENDKKVPLYSIHVNPGNSYEYTVGGRDHFVRVYDKRCIRRNEGFLKKYCPHNLVGSDIRANVTSVVYSYNGEEILASFNDEDIYLFDTHASDTSQYLHRYKGHRNSQTVKGVNFFGPKSEYVISGSDCGYIFFWDKRTEHIVKFMHGDEGGVVNCLEPNPNIPVLATSGLDDDIKIWVPSCEYLPDMSGLRDHVVNNMKYREEERRQDAPDGFDDQMIWFLMQHLRRARRRSQSTMNGTGNVTGNASSNSSSSDSDSHDEEAEFHHAIQCSQS